MKLYGEENYETLREANNYASSFLSVERFEEARPLLRKVIPVARRVLGENHELTLSMRQIYAQSLYQNEGATLERVARRPSRRASARVVLVDGRRGAAAAPSTSRSFEGAPWFVVRGCELKLRHLALGSFAGAFTCRCKVCPRSHRVLKDVCATR